jgi:hypothetical protein
LNLLFRQKAASTSVSFPHLVGQASLSGPHECQRNLPSTEYHLHVCCPDLTCRKLRSFMTITQQTNRSIEIGFRPRQLQAMMPKKDFHNLNTSAISTPGRADTHLFRRLLVVHVRKVDLDVMSLFSRTFGVICG